MNDDGLYRKFDIYKPRDGRTIAPIAVEDQRGSAQTYVSYPSADRIGANGEFVFVLRPETDDEAWRALDMYANEVHRRAPRLALDIRERLAAIKRTNV